MNAPDVRTTDTGQTEYNAPGTESTQDMQSVDIERAKNGGFVARCRYQQSGGKGDSPSYSEPTVQAFSTFDELVSFLQSEFGTGNEPPKDDVTAERYAPPAAAAAPTA